MATDDIIKDDNNEYEDICYMCRRPESVAGKMLKMTGNMCVCRDCMQKTFDMMSGGDNPLGDMGFGLFPGMGFPGMQIQDIPKSQRLRKKAKPETAGAAGGEDAAEAPVFDFRKLPPPHKIREKLDEYVIGQDRAKKIISVAVYNHYTRVTKDASGDIEIEK